MVLFEFTDDHGVSDVVDILDTTVGKGVFTCRPYPETAVIGEITGELIRGRAWGSDYAFDLEEGLQLEPGEPFRYVNHCCDPNCEFDWVEERSEEGRVPRLYLVALRDIDAGEQLTIDYNWPSIMAIPCDCRSPLCRGWVVSEDEIGSVTVRNWQEKSVMTKLSKATPIFRIFDEQKAREFYTEYLEFSVVFEHRFGANMPLYMGMAWGEVTLHLSEHHGDCCPGSAVRVMVDDVDGLHASLKAKSYRYANPGVQNQPWGSREMSIQDPFGNRITFFQDISDQAKS